MNTGVMVTSVSDVLDELYFGKPKRQHVKEFGYVFAIIFSAIAGYLVYKHHDFTTAAWLLFASLILVVSSIRLPKIVLPVWQGWMKIAHVLGTVMTFLIISLTWFVIAVPIGLLLKVVGKKVMDLSYNASVETYWEDRAEKYHDFKLLERQF